MLEEIRCISREQWRGGRENEVKNTLALACQ
jgi:hypothetical protein